MIIGKMELLNKSEDYLKGFADALRLMEMKAWDARREADDIYDKLIEKMGDDLCRK